MTENAAHIEGLGIVSTDRLDCPVNLTGLDRHEKRRIAALTARRNYLEAKLQDVPKDRLHYDKAELSALDWALGIIQDYYDHINICDQLSKDEEK